MKNGMAVLVEPGATAVIGVGVLVEALLTIWKRTPARVAEVGSSDRVPSGTNGVLPPMRKGTAVLEDGAAVARLEAKTGIVVAGVPLITNGTVVLICVCRTNDDDVIVVASASSAISKGTAVLDVELDSDTEGGAVLVTGPGPITKGIAVLVAISN
jgi:uncharacterized membrane protein